MLRGEKILKTYHSTFVAMITSCGSDKLYEICQVINDGASAYKGVIPIDRWQEPYMTEHHLKLQVEDGVHFVCFLENGCIVGVMGVQNKGEVTLIRHAYVRSLCRKRGIGSSLLRYLLSTVTTPVLIGTWRDAWWAVEFYQKHGFVVVTEDQSRHLLRRYWKIPERQVETSLVLVSADWQPDL